MLGALIPALPASAVQQWIGPPGEGMKILGTLKGAEATGFETIVGLLPEEKQLIHYRQGADGFQFVKYDLSTPVPEEKKIVEVDDTRFHSDYTKWGVTITADESRHILYKLIINPHGFTGTILRLNTTTLRSNTTPSWELGERGLVGFMPFGITYSKRDDRLYIIGEWSGSVHASEHVAGQFSGAKPATVTAVAALEAGSGDLAWVKVVPQCIQPVVTTYTGSVIARSDYYEALYFACMRTHVHPGLSGVTRLWITPGTGRENANQEDALGFKVEFFPVSGSVVSPRGLFGLMAFDRPSDRVIFQSVTSASPGSWVFDGLTSSWIGQMAAPRQPLPEALGVSESTGHVYMASLADPAYLDVADARATPAPQGQLMSMPTPVAIIGNLIVTDPKSKRVFLGVNDLTKFGRKAEGPGGKSGYLVLEDHTPTALPPVEIKYDDLTTDVPEGPNTEATFAGNAAGYGSHVTVVGGYGGVRSRFEGLAQNTGDLTSRFDLISPGDRGFFAGRVASVDLRNTGASASAQAFSPDIVTDSDRGNVQTSSQTPPSKSGDKFDEALDSQGIAQNELTADLGHNTGEQVREAGVDVDSQAGPAQTAAKPLLSWPWSPAACLDSGEEDTGSPPTEPDAGPGGSAEASCSFAQTSASAAGVYGPIDLDTGNGVRLRVAASSFTAEAFRDPKRGLVTVTLAEARGFEVTVAGAGTLSIMRVLAESTTRAAGRPGTTDATWKRTMEGVRLVDSRGNLVFVCDDRSRASSTGTTQGCNPRELVNAANALFESQIRVLLPTPEIVETPKGAFAGVQKRDADYYSDLAINNEDSRTAAAFDMLVINDSVGKSRLRVQLAAIQAGSIYGITQLSDPLDPGLDDGGDEGTLVPPTIFNPDPGPGPTGPQVQPNPPVGDVILQSVREAMLLVRSPKDAVLVGIVWSLFAAAGAGALRRRKLTKLLQEGS